MALRLLLIPVYWALGIGFFLTLDPVSEPSVRGATLILGGFTVAAVLSAENFFWWQQRAKLSEHFANEWRCGLVRVFVAFLAGLVFGTAGALIGLLQASGPAGMVVTGIIGIIAGCGFSWVQTHKYLMRRDYGRKEKRIYR